MNTFTSILMSLVFIASTSAFAGPKISTRADVIILPDDSVVLADPFIDAQATQEAGGPLLQLLNPRIYQTIALYRQVGDKVNVNFSLNRNSTINRVMDELLDKRNKLRFFGLATAEEMNKYCFAGRPVYKVPTGGVVQQAACTKGNDTFIVKPLFLRLSIRDQAMLLIHERLTTVADDRGWINFSAIAKYTTGLNTYLNIYNEQNRRIYRELSSEEQQNLFNFYSAIQEIEYRNAPYGTVSGLKWNVHKNGGGLISIESNVHPSAFIPMNTTIHGKSEIEANTKIINFNAVETVLVLAEGSSIENVTSHGATRLIKLGANSKLSGVDFTYIVGPIAVGANSVIKNSTVTATNFKIGDNVSISDSRIEAKSLVINNGVLFQEAKFIHTPSEVTVAEREQLVNQESNHLFNAAYYPAGMVPKEFSLTLNVPDFKCVVSEKAEKKSWGWGGSTIGVNGNGVKLSGWITYNGRNGLKKEYEYNYSDTKIEISFKTFERAKTPVTILNDKGMFVPGDYSRNNLYVQFSGYDECSYSVIRSTLISAGFPLTSGGYLVPIKFN